MCLGRKPIVAEQSTVIVQGPAVHGPLALTPNRPLIDSGNAQKPSTLDQNTVSKEVSVVESAEEDPVVVVIDPSSLLANESTTKGAQSIPLYRYRILTLSNKALFNTPFLQ